MSQNDLSTLHGFDPLAEQLAISDIDLNPFEAATQRAVLNILKSYTGYFDVFSELIQNALDAIDARKRHQPFNAEVKIAIDISEETLTISDNGVGMDENELRFCFRPSVSFKTRKEARGHKGVGATFLAYGFESISVWTIKKGQHLAIRLVNGRVWAESTQNYRSRPKLEDITSEGFEHPFDAGTTVKIVIGKSNRPDLTWWNATSE
jgi:Histidine kinase-, DNA gyrase B-, and HSP90-like ATPase